LRTLIPQFIVDKILKNEKKGSFEAITLFLDISGFTSMTERLMQEGKEGAEVLSEIINNIFEPVIDSIYSCGGFISNFAGDAFTAIFQDRTHCLMAVACAVEIERIFTRVSSQQTKFGTFDFWAKLGLSAGKVDFGIIDGQKYKTFYFGGEAIRGCALSVHHCQKTGIVIDSAILNLIPEEETEKVKIANGYFHLIACKQPYKTVKFTEELIPDKIRRDFIPPKITELTQNGEFREIATIFISFKESDNYDKQNEMISAIADKCCILGGYFNRVDYGDKGGVILVIFGAPVSYENNLHRAVDFLYSIRDRYRENIRAGITYSMAYTGFIGSKRRCEYTANGDKVNQAVRLMSVADWGEIFVSANVERKLTNLYFFHDIGNVLLKGKSESVAVYALMNRKEEHPLFFFSGEMVGRERELNLLQQFSHSLNEKRFCGITTVYGEAGMGKSRLIYEFTKNIQEADIIFLQTDSILKMSMNPFKQMLHHYFKQAEAKSVEEKKVKFEIVFNSMLLNLKQSSDIRCLPVIKELERTKTLFAAQIGIHYENSLYTLLEPKDRFENIVFAYKEFFKGLSLLKPLIIIIEDIHWLDDDSHKVFRTLCRSISDLPVMIIAAARFNDDGSKPILKTDQEIILHEIVLDRLDQQNAESFLYSRLGGKSEKSLLQFINGKAEYNPFYIEQIVSYLKENELLIIEKGEFRIKQKDIEIPDTINALIISRIDRLENELKNILQVASVCGREVELRILLDILKVYQSYLDRKQINVYLERIENEQLWFKLNELRYIFRHSLLHEAIYEMQLKARLRELHGLAADAIREIFAEKKERYYEIACHYDKAENTSAAKAYYYKAGEWFKSNYENLKAIECYDRLSEYLAAESDTSELTDVLVEKGIILQFIGKWNDAEIQYQKAYDVAVRKNDSPAIINSGNKLAWIKNDKGNKDAALELYENSLKLARELGDDQRISGTYSSIGYVYGSKGDYRKGMENYQISIEMDRKLGDKYNEAHSIGNVGIFHALQGNYEKAMECFIRYRDLAEELNDKRGMSVSLGNMGNVYRDQGNNEKAMDCYHKYLQISEEIGNKLSIAYAIGNIGIMYSQENKYTEAIECFERKRQISIEMGDKMQIAISSGNIGNVFLTQGDYNKAMSYFNEYLQLSEEIGDKRGISISVGNMGVAYSATGDYEKAVSCYLKKLKVAEELNDRGEISLAYGNLGSVYKDQGNYSLAMNCFDKAITIGKELGIKFYLCSFLYKKAELLYTIQNYADAGEINQKAGILAKEVNRKDIIFKSSVIEFKLLALLDRKEAVKRMKESLSNITVDEHAATIHFEIFILTGEENHRQKALILYQELSAENPNIDFQNRISKLTGEI